MFFSGKRFGVLLGPESDIDIVPYSIRRQLIDKVEPLGGIVSSLIDTQVTHVITRLFSLTEYRQSQSLRDAIHRYRVPLVNRTYIEKCVNAGRVIEPIPLDCLIPVPKECYADEEDLLVHITNEMAKDDEKNVSGETKRNYTLRRQNGIEIDEALCEKEPFLLCKYAVFVDVKNNNTPVHAVELHYMTKTGCMRVFFTRCWYKR
eukprot:PhF_6_TR601/c0_g2_i1/m.715